MKKTRDSQSMLKEAAQIKKQIEAGEFKGKKLQSAKYKVAGLRYRANKKIKERGEIAAVQQTLPNFLGQVDMVRIEELVLKRVVDELARQALTEIKDKPKKSRKGA